MKLSLLGILLSLTAIALLLYGRLTRDAEPAVEKPSGAAELLARVQEVEAEREELHEKLVSLEEQNAALETELSKARETTKPAVEDKVEADPKPEADEDAANRRQSLDEIRAVLRDNAGASAQIKSLAELMYADLFNDLDIDPETKAELRRLLTESLLESMALSRFALIEGDIPWSEVRGWEQNEREYLDAKLRDLLPPEAYQTWKDYFSEFDARQLEGNLRNQIGAVASGLTPENFDLVLQIAVEEFRAQQATLEQSNEPFTVAENMRYQLRAMEAMRARLSSLLAADQLAEIENWLTMAEQVLSAQIPQDDAN